MRSHRRNSVAPDHSDCRRGLACGNTRTGRIWQVALTCAPPAKPKVCWTGSSVGATIKQHPSSLARCSAQWLVQLASGVTAAPAYFGMRALQRRCSAHPPCPTQRPHAVIARAASAAHHKTEITPGSNDAYLDGRPRAAIQEGDRSHQRPQSKTAFRKPEKRGS